MTNPTSRPPSSTQWWLCIFSLALGLRIFYLYQIEDLAFFHHLVGDAKAYDEWAQQLADGRWRWPDAFYQAPLYPYFLGCLYTLFGRSLWLVRIVQCLLSACACVMIGAAGARFLSIRVGRVAALLMAVYPPAFYFDGVVQKASLGSFLMSALLLVLAVGGKRSSWWIWTMTGMMLGLLALTRENTLVLVPIVIAWLVATRDGPSNRWRRWAPATLTVAGLSAVLFPIALHNREHGGGLSLTTTQMGPNFYMGNHAGADGRYAALIPGRETPEFERADATALAEAATERTLSPRAVSDYWLRLALTDIASDPFRWLKLLGTKWWLTWNRYEIPDTESYYLYREESWLLNAMGSVFHFGVLCPMAVVGAVLTWPRRKELWLLYAIALGLAASVAVFYVFGRYRYPLVPVLMIFAASGVTQTIGWIRIHRGWAAARLLGVTAAAALWVNWPINPETELNAGQLGNLGAALARQDRVAEALPYFENAVAALPDAPRLRQFLADGLSMTGRHQDAIPHYEATLSLQPDRPNAHFNLAVALEAVGRAREAARHYRRALVVDPTDADARRAIERLTDER